MKGKVRKNPHYTSSIVTYFGPECQRLVSLTVSWKEFRHCNKGLVISTGDNSFVCHIPVLYRFYVAKIAEQFFLWFFWKPEVTSLRQKLKYNGVYNSGTISWHGVVELATSTIISVQAAVLFFISPSTADDVTSPSCDFALRWCANRCCACVE
jgi:hypothetical protein